MHRWARLGQTFQIGLVYTKGVWPWSSLEAGKGAGKVVSTGLTKLVRKHRMSSHGKCGVWEEVDCLCYGITNLKGFPLAGMVAHTFNLSTWDTEVGRSL